MIHGTRLQYRPYLSQDPPEEELGEDADVRREAFENDREGMYVEVEGIDYGDYGGGMVNRSNYEEFLEQFAGHRSTEWWTWAGSHGSHGIILRVDADERVPQIGQFFDDLRDYGSASDERLSQLEEEAIEEAWADYGEQDFIREMIRLDPDLRDPFDELDDAQVLVRLRWAVDRAANETPYVEDAAGGVSFRPYYSVLRRAVRADPYALEVAFGLAALPEDRAATGPSPLDYLFEEIGRGMPAFYYALLGFNPTAARILGARPNAREFAEAYSEEVENVPWVEVARLMSVELANRPVGFVEVLADMIEQGDVDQALEMLDRPRGI